MTVAYPALIAYMDLGDSDCEHIGAGLFNQPANTWSSVAYVVFGLWLVVRSIRTRGAETPVGIAFGAALVSIGIGSVAFHGPVPPGARLMHDLTIAAAVIVIAARNIGTFRNWAPGQVLARSGIIVAIIGAVMAVAPDAGNMLTGAVGVTAVVSEIALYRTGRQRFSSRVARPLGTMVALLIGAAVINVMGRTGGPLCDPESVFQGHAVWHVLTAASFTLYGYAAFPRGDARPPHTD